MDWILDLIVTVVAYTRYYYRRYFYLRVGGIYKMDGFTYKYLGDRVFKTPNKYVTVNYVTVETDGVKIIFPKRLIGLFRNFNEITDLKDYIEI